MFLLIFLIGQWIKEPGIRVETGSVPYVISLEDTAYRLYHTGQGIESSISLDGLNFTHEPGIRIPVGDSMERFVADPSVVKLAEGYRMYYKGATGTGGPGQARHRIFSAFSTDGLNWTKEGLRYENLGYPDYGWTSVPDAIQLLDGRIRIYYTSATGGIRSIISDNGLEFEPENGVRLNAVDPNVIYLADSSFRMFFATQVGQPQHLGYAESPDGINFTIIDTIIHPDGPNDSLSCVDPSAIFLPDGRTRIYYGGMNQNRVVTLSAISQAGEMKEINYAEPGKIDFKISPNPARSQFTISSPWLKNPDVRLKMYNALGNLIKEVKSTGQEEFTIPIDDKGIVFVILEANGKEIKQKVIVSE